MSGFVVIGRDVGTREPSLAVGPFPTREAAGDFQRSLVSTTSGSYVILSLHTPVH